MLEVPSTEIVEAEIVRLNGELKTLIRNEAIAQGLEEVDKDQLPKPEDREIIISPTTTAAGFWNHFIGGPLAAVDGQIYLLEETGRFDPDVVRGIQGRLHLLVSSWMQLPQSGEDSLNIESCNAFLDGAYSFDWTRVPTLTRRLKDHLADLGDQYILREGKIPLGYTPR